jgi:predicted dinucleotide-binding enzyme
MESARQLPPITRRSVIAIASLALGLLSLSLTSTPALPQGAAAKPRIGLIGSGNVGSNLGRAWALAGYQVMFSSKDIEADRKLAATVGANARAGTPQEAAAFGDVLVLAVPYGAQPELGKTLGGALRGKVVIDASNPFPARDGAIADEARAQGAGLVSSRLLPGARIVRAFNAVGAARMGAMHETPGKVAMPYAGDDAQALEIAARLIRDVGFEPVKVGGLAMGKHLMPGTPLAGEHTADEIRKLASGLAP